MTDTSPDGELADKPEPEIEPGEPNPGGVDAMPDRDGDNVAADLPVELNPAVDETATPTLAEGEDTSTKATKDEDADDTEEAPA